MIGISKVKGRKPLYERLPGEWQPQRAFVELDCESDWLYTCTAERSGQPIEVFTRRVLRWELDPEMGCRKINRLLKDIEPFAERIVAGFHTDWDGRNIAGFYTDDAEDAIDEVSRLVYLAKDPFAIVEIERDRKGAGSMRPYDSDMYGYWDPEIGWMDV